MFVVVADCEMNIHKNCLDRVHDACLPSGSSPSGGGTLRKKQSKPRQSSVFNVFASRKPSTNSPAASAYAYSACLLLCASQLLISLTVMPRTVVKVMKTEAVTVRVTQFSALFQKNQAAVYYHYTAYVCKHRTGDLCQSEY